MLLKKLKIDNINRLVIGQININGLHSKIDALRLLVSKNLDLLIVVESKLDQSFPNTQFSIEGFGVPFRLDRNKFGGGVMVYIRDDIVSKELKTHKTILDIEGIFIEINLRNKKWLLFAGYNNSKTTIRDCYGLI